MSRKVTEHGPGKMTASTSRGGRIAAVLGVLNAMVRGGHAGGRPGLAGRFVVPPGTRMGAPQVVAVPGGDLRLVQ